MNKVDALGLSCPEPLLLTQAALGKKGTYQILVDNHTAKERVVAYIQEMGLEAKLVTNHDEYEIIVTVE